MTTNLTNTNPKFLNEITLIRLLLIVLLVLYHAFAPFCGAWTELQNQELVATPYKWVGMSAYSFMLECFTFISGYVFGYQVMRKGAAALDIRTVAVKKFKRLIIPSIIFSLIYLLIFNLSTFGNPIVAGWKIINGVGHMWYLPMLFWCFLSVCILEKTNFSPKLSIILVALISCIPLGMLPLGFGSAMYYMLFVYIGYLITKSGLNPISHSTPKYIIIFATIFVLTFILFSSELFVNLGGGGDNSGNLLFRYGFVILNRISRIIFSTFGVLTVISLSTYLIYSLKIKLSQQIINLSTYCFGVYLFQQFILQYIYYHTSLLESIGIYALPWLAFTITLAISLAFTWVLLKTKTGRLLIG